jgi:hypothetical protein
VAHGAGHVGQHGGGHAGAARADGGDGVQQQPLARRTVRVWAVSLPTGTGRRMSTATLASRWPGAGSQASMTRAARADGGPPCWAAVLHGPMVDAVAANVSGPAGSKKTVCTNRTLSR